MHAEGRGFNPPILQHFLFRWGSRERPWATRLVTRNIFLPYHTTTLFLPYHHTYFSSNSPTSCRNFHKIFCFYALQRQTTQHATYDATILNPPWLSKVQGPIAIIDSTVGVFRIPFGSTAPWSLTLADATWPRLDAPPPWSNKTQSC